MSRKKTAFRELAVEFLDRASEAFSTSHGDPPRASGPAATGASRGAEAGEGAPAASARILVLDGDTRAALAATRSLGRRHAVWVGAPERRSLAGSSRFAAGRRTLPDPLAGAEAFARAVAREVRERAFELVLPVSDAACRALLPRPELLAPARLAAPSFAAYERLSDKGRVAEAARRHGLGVPRGRPAQGLEEALAAAREVGFPVFVKPLRSVDPVAGGGLVRRAVARAEGEEELRRILERVPGAALLVQEAVPGAGEGLSLLRWAGRTRAAFAHRRLREKPPAGGVSVLSESVPARPERLRAVEALLDELGYEGLAMAEFKCEGERAWLMEFNARPWGSLQLAIDAGVDFPALLVDCVRGRPPETPPAYAVGRRLRWWLGDLDHAIALARGAADGGAGRRLRAAAGVLLWPTGPRSRLELLRREDPRPFAHALARWLRREPL